MKGRVICLIHIVLFFSVYFVYGQDIKKDTLEVVEILDEVVIIDSGFEINRQNSGKIVHKITSEQIEANQGRNVVDLINSVVGIEINGSRGSLGQNLGYFIRGGKSNEVVILIDGVQVVDPLQNNYDLRFLNLDQISHIEILKGASSTLYGAGASTAVIDIKLKKVKQGAFKASVSATIGSNNSQIRGEKGGFISTNDFNIIGKPSDLLDYNVSIGHKESKGFSATLPKEGDETIFKEDPFKRINASINLGFKISKKIYISTFGSYYKFDYNYDSGSYADAENLSKNENYRMGVAPKYAYKKGVIQLDAAYSTFDIDNTKTTFPGKNKGKNIVLHLFGKHKFNSKLHAIFGLNYQYNDIETFSTSFVTGELISTAYTEFPKTILLDSYANIVYVSERGINLNFGVRNNNHNKYGGHLVYNLNPSYTFKYNKKAYSKLFASYSTAFVAPSLQDLYAAWGNIELKPQESLTFEIGFETKIKSSFINITYFKREIENIISYNAGLGKIVNMGDTSTSGFEFGISYNLLKKIIINTNYTSISADNKAIRIPSSKINFTVQYLLNNSTDFAIKYQYNGKRRDTDFTAGQSVYLKKYSLIDFMANHKLNSTIKLLASVTNIFDEEFQEILGYNTLGRNYNVGVRLSF